MESRKKKKIIIMLYNASMSVTPEKTIQIFQCV